MAIVYRNVASSVAHMAGVGEAVRLERDKLAAVAEGLFASHDNPGGHSITTEDVGGTDGLFSLEGPIPPAVEFGHWTPDHKRFVDGLHILGRTVAQATL